MSKPIAQTKRELLIDAIADYIVHDMAMRSIHLQMGKPGAEIWSRVYRASGVLGYPTKAEAVECLKRALGMEVEAT